MSVEQQKDSKEFSDLTSVKLSHISQEIMVILIICSVAKVYVLSV